MYTLSSNKHFVPMFFKTHKSRQHVHANNKYGLADVTLSGLLSFLTSQPTNKYYVSKIYLTKYTNWVFIYLFVYSITNLRVKTFRQQTKLKYSNVHLLNKVYMFARTKYLAS